MALDGNLTIAGDWSNESDSSLALGDNTSFGTVILNGSALQTIGGTDTSQFENLQINNANNVSLAGVDHRVSNTLTFTNGLINTSGRKMILSSNITVIGSDASKYVNGTISQEVSASTFTIPIGSAANYEEAIIEISTLGTLQYVDFNFTVDGAQVVPGGLTVNNVGVDDFLDYGYWTLTPDAGGTGTTFDLTIRSEGHTNGGGNEEDYSVIADIGSGWQSLGSHSPSTQSFDGGGIISKRSNLTSFGDFIIAKSTAGVYTQPTITNELRNNQTKIKIDASTPFHVIGTNGDLNNSDTASFTSEGVVSISGNINNNRSQINQSNGSIAVTGNFTSDSTFNQSAGKLTVSGNIVNQDTAIFISSDSLIVSGNFTNTDSAIAQIGGFMDLNGDLLNNDSCQLEINGRINIAGDFTNNGIDSLALGDLAAVGTVSFDGSALQTIGGTAATIFENLELNNSSNVTLSGAANIQIDDTITFTNGLLIGNGGKVIVTNTDPGAWVNFSETRYIQGVIRQFTATQTYSLPVGTGAFYELATLEIGTLGSLQYVDVEFTIDGSQTPPAFLTVNGANIDEFLDYGYWTITPNTPSHNASFDLTLRSDGHSNGGGDEEDYAVLSDVGAGWVDQGTHSPSTQSFEGSAIIAKRSNISNFGDFIIGRSFEEVYTQPIITNELRNNGAIFKIDSTDQVYVLGASGDFNNDNKATTEIFQDAVLDVNGNLSNVDSSKISIDGSVLLIGSWTNSGFGDLSLLDNTTKGTVSFTGTTNQTLNGDSITVFENLTVNNSDNITMNTQPAHVSNQVIFTTGLINTNGYLLQMADTASFSGQGDNTYVNGKVRQYINNGTFEVPVGTAGFYQLATFTFNDTASADYIDVEFIQDGSQTVPAALTVSGALITEFLDYGYWKISANAIDTFNFDLEVRSGGHTNGGGTPDKYALISDLGSGWVSAGNHASGTQSFDGGFIIAKRTALTRFGEFIVGKSEDDTYTQPTLTNEIRNKQSYFKLDSAEQVFVIGDDGDFNNDTTSTVIIHTNAIFDLTGNIANDTNATLSIDGQLLLEGNLTNNSSNSFRLLDANSKGTITFDGTTEQFIRGVDTAKFENLVINNASNVSIENQSILVTDSLDFIAGLLNSGVVSVVLSDSININGNDDTKYISGKVRQFVNANTFEIPIGSPTIYQQAILTFSDATGVNYVDISFTEDASQTPPTGLTVSGAAITEFLNYGYWTLSPDNAGSPVFDLEVRSGGHSNGGGTPGNYALIGDPGSGWASIGNHSSGTQSFDGGFIIAKRTSLGQFGDFIVGKSEDDTYSQPTLTNELRNKQAFFKVDTSDQLFIIGDDGNVYNDTASTIEIFASAIVDITGELVNDTNAVLAIDGQLLLEGDFTNNSNVDFSLLDASAKGRVVFDGSSEQLLTGTDTSQFEVFEINNASNITLQTTSPYITDSLVFTNGIINTEVLRLALSDSITVVGSNDNNYVNGSIRQLVTNREYTIPLGTPSFYEEAVINFNDATGVNYIDVSFTEDGSQTPPIGLTVSGAAITELLNYGYWTISPDNVGSPTFDLTVRADGHSNGGGSPGQYALVSDLGSNWEDAGNHSSATQSFDGSAIIARRTALTQFGDYIIGKSEDDTYTQPTLTNELRNKQSYVKLDTAEQLFVIGADGNLNNDTASTIELYTSSVMDIAGDVINDTNALISLDGQLKLAGDWTNYSSNPLNLLDAASKGRVVFDGTDPQIIGGTDTTQFENLEIDNSANVTLQNHSQYVTDSLIFTNGLINTDAFDVVLSDSIEVTGNSDNNYINGSIRQFVTTRTYELPVGTSSFYELATIEFTTATGLSAIDVSFTEDNSQTVPPGLLTGAKTINDFLNYGYWNIDDVGGFTAVDYNIRIRSNGHSNGGGDPADYVVIADTTPGVWEDMGIHTDVSQSFDGTAISALRSNLVQFGRYTIGRDIDPAAYPVTEELHNKGGVFRINGSEPVDISGGSAIVKNSSNGLIKMDDNTVFDVNCDIINENTATIDLNGTIQLEQGWTNNGTASLELAGGNEGTVEFDGIVEQSVYGNVATIFENIHVNNSNNIKLDTNQQVSNQVVFTSGLIDATTDTLIITNSATDAFTGNDESKYINGVLRQYVANGTYELPVGTASFYELAEITLSNTVGINYLDVNYNIASETPPGGLTVNSIIIDDFLDYGYWTINEDAGSADFVLTVTNRGQTDLGGNADRYAILSRPAGTWVDNGIHSTTTQNYSPTVVSALRSGLSEFGDFIIGRANQTLYFQPTITEELRNKGAIFRVSGAEPVDVSGGSAIVNNSDNGLIKMDDNTELDINGDLLNAATSTISTNGTIAIEQNWTNNGTTSLALAGGNDGTVQFDGSNEQSLYGTVVTGFENIVVDNVNNIKLDTNQEVAGQITFTDGLLDATTDTIIVTNSATDAFSGNDDNKYILGDLRQYVTNGTYELPIGTSNFYQLAELTLTNVAGLSYVDVSFTEASLTPPGGLTINLIPISDFLDYGFWTITEDAGTADFDLTLRSNGHTDLGGGADRYAVLSRPVATWEDNGSHSLTTQTYTSSIVTAKRSALSEFGDFIIGRANQSLYLQPTITNELRNKGAVLRLNGSSPVDISGSSAAVNNSDNAIIKLDDGSELDVNGDLDNSAGSTISLNGDIELSGIFNNDGIASLSLAGGNAGTVLFDGTAIQDISGSSNTEFENLTINNSNDLRLDNVDAQVDSVITFTNGSLLTQTNRLIVTKTTGSAFSGNDDNKYIVGNLRHFVSNGSYQLPIGTASFSELAEITLSNVVGLSYLDVSFTQASLTPPGGLTVNTIAISDFLDYGFWSINEDAGTADFDLRITSIGHTDLGGGSDRYAVLSRPAGTWVDNGVHSIVTQTYNATTVSALRSALSDFGDFIVGRAGQSLFIQPVVTQELRNKGAIFRINGTAPVDVSGSSAAVNNSDGGELLLDDNTELDIAGDLTNEAASTVEVDGTIQLTENWTNNGTASIERTGGNQGTVVFDGSAEQNIEGSNSTTFENLTVSNPNDVTLNGVDAQVENTLTFTNGLLNTGVDSIIVTNADSSGIIGFSENRYINGNLRRYVSAQDYDLPIGTSAFYQLATIDIQSQTGLNFLDVSFTIDGTQSTPGGLNTNGDPVNDFLDYGYWSINGNASFSAISHTLTVRAQGQTNNAATADLHVLISDLDGTGWADNGVHSSSTQSFDGTAVNVTRSTLTGLGDFIVGIIVDPFSIPPTNDLHVKGARFLLTGTQQVGISGNNAQILNDEGIILVPENTILLVEGNFTNRTSSDIELDGTLQVTGDFENDGSNDLSDGDATDFGTVEFIGSDPQTMRGTANTSFENITVNNSGNGVILETDIVITQSLTMTDGDFDLRNNNIDLDSTGAISGETNDNRVKATDGVDEGTGTGTITATRIVDSVSNFNFAGLGLIMTTTDSIGSTVVIRGHLEQTGLNGNPSIHRYLDISPSIVNDSVSLSMTYFEDELGSIGASEDDFVIFHFDSTWDEISNGSSNATVNIVTARTDDFSPFAIGIGSTPLPITLVYFDAYYEDQIVNLIWETSEEINSDRFEVEKSSNARIFGMLTEVQAAGFSNELLQYEVYDYEPFNGLNYYRLKSVDLDGTYEYSPTVSVDVRKDQDITLYPNPIRTDELLHIEFMQPISDEKIDVTLTSINGIGTFRAQVSNSREDLTKIIMQLHEANLATGTYLLTVESNSVQHSEKIIIR